MHALFRESNVNQELEEIEWHIGDVFDNLPNRIKRPSFQTVILYLIFEEYRSASQGCMHTQSCACLSNSMNEHMKHLVVSFLVMAAILFLFTCF